MTKNSQAQYVVTHHGKTGHTLKVKIYEYCELLVMKKADAVIAVSEDMKKMLKNDGVKEKNLHVVENFMTSAIYPDLAKTSESIKFLFVGRLSPEKGCDVLIKALDKDMHLTVVGDGVDRKKLEDLSKDLNVRFMGFRNDVAKMMSEHDVVVMPSYREGQPLTLIEACCLGIPVVASRVGGIPELITDGVNGLLFKAGNAPELKNRLKKIQSEYKHFSKNGQNQKENFRIRFSASNWAARTSGIYLRLFSQE